MTLYTQINRDFSTHTYIKTFLGLKITELNFTDRHCILISSKIMTKVLDKIHIVKSSEIKAFHYNRPNV